MPTPNRPSHKERSKKLREAMEALAAGRRVVIGEERHFTEDLQELRSGSAEIHFGKISEFLEEIASTGGAECYTGSYPPYRCYHKGFADVELFAFSWDSSSEGRKMYLKFGIRLNKKTGVPTYLYLNCHEDNPAKKNR